MTVAQRESRKGEGEVLQICSSGRQHSVNLAAFEKAMALSIETKVG